MAVSISAALLLGACGGSTTPVATGAPTATSQPTVPATPGASSTPTVAPTTSASDLPAADPCRLLTAAEAEAALGKPVADPVRLEFDGPTGPGTDCHYDSVDQSSGPASIHVGYFGEGIPRADWEAAQRADGLEEVSGAGEIAFFDEDDATLEVYDAGRWIQLQMINSERFDETLAILVDVAGNALERI